MLNKVGEMFEAVKIILTAFRDTAFSQVKFDSLGLALGAGFFLLAVLLYKILWGRSKSKHYFSGHKIPEKYSDPLWRRIVCLIPFVTLALSVLFLILAIANPYLPRTKIETVVESLEIVYLDDVSTSKGWPFEDTGMSAGEITRRARLEFLKMRRGQNDRASLWFFSTTAHKGDDFIIDDEVFMLQAEDAPYVITGSNNGCLPENDPQGWFLDVVAPRDMILILDGEGGTQLVAGLRAVIRYFDFAGRKNIKRKALVIETDAAIEEDPELEFVELKKRGIIPYFILIKANIMGESRGCGGPIQYDPDSMSRRLQDLAKKYGGSVFYAQDNNSLRGAYNEINKLERSQERIIRHLLKVIIFQRPLMVAAILGILSMVFGLFTGLFFEAYP